MGRGGGRNSRGLLGGSQEDQGIFSIRSHLNNTNLSVFPTYQYDTGTKFNIYDKNGDGV